MLLSLMDDPNRIAVQGKVVWITPGGRAGQSHAGHRRAVHAGRHRRRGARARSRRSSASRSHRRARRIRCSGASGEPGPRPKARGSDRSRVVASGRRLGAAGHPEARSPCSSIRTVISISRSSRASCPRCSTRWRRRASRTRSASRSTFPDWPAVHALALRIRISTRRSACIPTTRTRRSRPSTTWSRSPRREKIVAIGETGLDYYRLTGDLEWQRQRFRTHIRAARRAGKPLVIHTRSAGADTLAIMREEGAGEAGGVMHCFTETWDVARAALDLGFHISFSGIVTFKNAQALKDVARRVPLDRMLIETDSPYLAPVPHRGQAQPASLRAPRRRRDRAPDRRAGRDDRAHDERQLLPPVPDR